MLVKNKFYLNNIKKQTKFSITKNNTVQFDSLHEPKYAKVNKLLNSKYSLFFTKNMGHYHDYRDRNISAYFVSLIYVTFCLDKSKNKMPYLLYLYNIKNMFSFYLFRKIKRRYFKLIQPCLLMHLPLHKNSLVSLNYNNKLLDISGQNKKLFYFLQQIFFVSLLENKKLVSYVLYYFKFVLLKKKKIHATVR